MRDAGGILLALALVCVTGCGDAQGPGEARHPTKLPDRDGTRTLAGRMAAASYRGATDVGESEARLHGRVAVDGAALYRFQLSGDGRRWRDVGAARRVGAVGRRAPSAPVRGLRPGAAYLARLRVRVGKAPWVPSAPGVLVTDRPERVLARRPARAFAPLVRLHRHERFFPIGAGRFLERSTLKWRDAECIVLDDVATGRIADRKTADPTVPWLDPARLGPGNPFRRRALGRGCDRRRGRAYAASELTRPYDPGRRASGLTRRTGFYLDMLSDSKDGDPRFALRGGRRHLTGATAYYDQRDVSLNGRPGVVLSYWMLYARGMAPRRHGDPLWQHEGDWERVDVVLRRGRRPWSWLPRAVRFHVDRRSYDVPWSDVERRDTHPVIYAARDSHVMYSGSGTHGRTVAVGRRRVALRDETMSCDRCVLWLTWRALRPVRRQPWFGFGGGWGFSFESDRSSGPLGPR